MATSANERLKQLLAKKVNKESQHESKKEDQKQESPVGNPETTDAVQSGNDGEKVDMVCTVDVDNKQTTNQLVVQNNSGTLQETMQETSLGESRISEEISAERKAFFDTPFGRMMQEFQVALDNQLPGMATILRDIHLHLSKDVDIVTRLSDEEIGSIVRGLESIKGQTIVTNPKTGKSTGGKKMPVSASML